MLRLCLGASSCWFGCGSPPPASPEPPAVTRPTATEPTLSDRGWAVLRSPRLGVKLALPDARGWTQEHKTAAWQLRHEATGTTLSLHRWRASRLPRVEACEAMLRQRIPGLGHADETTLVGVREMRVPQGFVTRVTLLSLPANGRHFYGQAIAVGAGVGECLVAVASTETSSEAELADRLQLFDVALGHLRLTHIEDRVPGPTHALQ